MKVCIFIDGQNFYRSLQRYDDSLRVDYDRLATWMTQAVGGATAMFGGAYYYVGVSAGAPPLVEGFLKGLELRPGYFVKREPRVRRTGRCSACGGEYEYTTEKRVDTRLVADLIHYAANGAYEAAVLVSGDDDFVPAVEAVNALGKQVWVATWSAEELSTDLRVRCFGHIHLSEGVVAFRADRQPGGKRGPRRAAHPRPSARTRTPRSHPSPRRCPVSTCRCLDRGQYGRIEQSPAATPTQASHSYEARTSARARANHPPAGSDARPRASRRGKRPGVPGCRRC